MNNNLNFNLYSNDILSESSCQTNNLNHIPWNKIDPYPNILSPVGTILSFDEADKKVLNLIVTYGLRYKNKIHASQINMAEKLKLHRITVNRSLQKIGKFGFIAIKNNGANKPCWYKISSWFFNTDIQQQLSKKLAVFYYTNKFATQLLISQTTRSINVFNFIYKTTNKLRNVNTSTYMEEKYQRILKKGKSVSVIEKIKQELALENYETNQLSNFDEVILQQAYGILKSKSNVANKFRYLLGICNQLQIKTVTSSDQKKSQSNAKQKSQNQPPHPPITRVDLTREENHARFAEWYNQYIEEYSSFYGCSKEFISRRFMEDFERDIKRWTPEQLERIKKRVAVQFGPEQTTNPTVYNIITKMHQNSNITNDNNSDNTNIHQTKKDSTMTKFNPNDNLSFDVNYLDYEEVYD